MKTIKIKSSKARYHWHADVKGYTSYFGTPSIVVCPRFISMNFPDLKKSREITLQLSDRPLKDSIVLFIHKTDENMRYSTSPQTKKPAGTFYHGTRKWLYNNFKLKQKEINKIYLRAK